MSKNLAHRLKWGMARAISATAVFVALVTSSAQAQPAPVSDRHLLDELRVAEIVLRDAVPRNWGYLIGFVSQDEALRAELNVELGSEYADRNRRCLKAVELFAPIGSASAQVLGSPSGPGSPGADSSKLQSAWTEYRAGRRECEASLGVPPMEILPDDLSELLSGRAIHRRRSQGQVPIDPSALSAHFALDRVRMLETRLRNSINRKSGDDANAVAVQIFDEASPAWATDPSWPAECSDARSRMLVVALLATGILDPSRVSGGSATSMAELDKSWDYYRAGRLACENEMNVAPVKILPDRLSEAF